MVIFYIGLGIVICYTLFMIAKTKHIPDSISDTYYDGAGNWFTIVMFIASFLLIAGMLEMTKDSYWQFVSFFTGTGMALVGAAPKFKTGEKIVHYLGASVLLAGSQMWLLLFGNPLALLVWLTAPLWYKSKKKIFWCEVICLLSVLLGTL